MLIFCTWSTLTRLRRGAALGLCAALALASVTPALGAATAEPAPTHLPSLGDGLALSLAAERRIGDRVAREIYQHPDYLDDPVLDEYLQSIWQPLLGAARARGDVSPELLEQLAWELMISRDRRVNAFALPGGYLGLNLGLIAVTDSADELASVLAHELVHVSQRHIARLLQRQERMAPWVLGSLILGALAASANADLANAAITGTQAVAAQTQLNFSRDMEREADRVGFAVLIDAGFDGQGFVSMFDKLQQANRLNDDGSFPYLRSHPLTIERRADMQARLPAPLSGAATPPPAQTSRSPELHALMAARARVLAESRAPRLLAWAQYGQTAGARAADLYAGAAAAQRLGQGALALTLAQRLRQQVAPAAHWAADALLLEVLLATPGASATANPLLAELRDQALRASGRGQVLLGAQAAIATGVPQRAAARLQDWVLRHPRDAQAWQTLAQAQQAQGQSLRALRSQAESHVARLDYAGALERLQAAQQGPEAQQGADPIDLAIIDSRRRAVQSLLNESLREN